MTYLEKLEQYNHEIVMENKKLAKEYNSIVSEAAGVPLKQDTDEYQGVSKVGNKVENAGDLTPDDNLKIKEECTTDTLEENNEVVSEAVLFESWFSRAMASVGTGFVDFIKGMGRRLFVVLSAAGLGVFFGYPGLIIGILLALGIVGRQIQKDTGAEYDTVVTEGEDTPSVGSITPEKQSILKKIVEFLKGLSKDTLKNLNATASKGWDSAKKVGQDIVNTVKTGKPSGVVSEALAVCENNGAKDTENEINNDDQIDGTNADVVTVVDDDDAAVDDDTNGSDAEDGERELDLTVVDDDVPVDGEDEDGNETPVVPITDEVKQQIIDLGVDTMESDCRFSMHFENEEDENFRTVLEILANAGVTGAVAITDFGTYIAVSKPCDVEAGADNDTDSDFVEVDDGDTEDDDTDTIDVVDVSPEDDSADVEVVDDGDTALEVVDDTNETNESMTGTLIGTAVGAGLGGVIAPSILKIPAAIAAGYVGNRIGSAIDASRDRDRQIDAIKSLKNDKRDDETTESCGRPFVRKPRPKKIPGIREDLAGIGAKALGFAAAHPVATAAMGGAAIGALASDDEHRFKNAAIGAALGAGGAYLGSKLSGGNPAATPADNNPTSTPVVDDVFDPVPDSAGVPDSTVTSSTAESIHVREARARRRIRENALQTREEFFKNETKPIPESIQNMLKTNKKLFTGNRA